MLTVKAAMRMTTRTMDETTAIERAMPTKAAPFDLFNMVARFRSFENKNLNNGTCAYIQLGHMRSLP
jgi:hypothetical protein